MTKVEQFIKEYTRSCSNMLAGFTDDNSTEEISYLKWLTPEQALRATEIAREELLDNVFKIVRLCAEEGWNFLQECIEENDIACEPYWNGYHDACEAIKTKLEELK